MRGWSGAGLWRELLRPSTLIAVLALFVALGGTGYAATRLAESSTAHGAKAKRGPKGPRGKRGPTGPEGKQGPRGEQGVPGMDGTADAWGYVFSDGTLSMNESHAVAGVEVVGPGLYCIKVEGVSPETHPPVVSLYNAGADYNAIIFVEAQEKNCPLGKFPDGTSFAVHTYRLTSLTGAGAGTPTGEPFVFAVP